MTSSWNAPRVPEPSSRVTTVIERPVPPRIFQLANLAGEDLLDLTQAQPADRVGGMDDNGQAVTGHDDLDEVLSSA